MEGSSLQWTLIYIGTTAIKQANIVPQLLAAHATSGCDTVAYMFGVGKATVVKVLLQGHRLNKLGESEANIDEVIEEATAFPAACYGSRVKESMSKLRYRMWLIKMAEKKVTATPKLKSL